MPYISVGQAHSISAFPLLLVMVSTSTSSLVMTPCHLGPAIPWSHLSYQVQVGTIITVILGLEKSLCELLRALCGNSYSQPPRRESFWVFPGWEVWGGITWWNHCSILIYCSCFCLLSWLWAFLCTPQVLWLESYILLKMRCIPWGLP